MAKMKVVLITMAWAWVWAWASASGVACTWASVGEGPAPELPGLQVDFTISISSMKTQLNSIIPSSQCMWLALNVMVPENWHMDFRGIVGINLQNELSTPA